MVFFFTKFVKENKWWKETYSKTKQIKLVMLYNTNPLNEFHTQIKINATTGSEIVATSVAKDYMRVDTSADDTLIAQMITQARIICENYISWDIVAKNRTLYLASVDDRFVLPFGPISSISSISVKGTNLAATAYETFGLGDTLIELNSLPAEEVKVTYITTGLDDSFLIQAILQMVSTYYDNRADFIIGKTVNEIPTNVKSSLSSYKNVFI